jgi:glyoxylase-like metal-dependent hydrolase (beta-lactamase superfamily II)
VGREVFEIYQTPGHSPGSLSICWLRDSIPSNNLP